MHKLLIQDKSQGSVIPTEARLWGSYKWVGDLLVTDGMTCWYDVKVWYGAGNGPNKGMSLTDFKEKQVADDQLNDYCLKLILYMVQDRVVLHLIRRCSFVLRLHLMHI